MSAAQSWEGNATLRWLRSGQLLREQRYTFTVRCDGLPQEDRDNRVTVRREVTLKLVCANTQERYGVPPSVVQIDVEETGEDFGIIPVLDRARWRTGSGFCYGSGIMRVGPPPEGAQLMDLQEIPKEQAK